MNLPMLTVDKNLEFFLKEQTEWDKQGITAVRVDSMQEAIQKLSKETFFFTLINADNVNCLPLLKVISSATSSPIFIVTSHFTLYSQIEAFQNGADAYAPFQRSTDENVKLALALWQRYSERSKQIKNKVSFISYKNLFVTDTFRQAFYDDKEIELTAMEFDLLHLLIENRGHVLNHEQIYKHVYGDENTVDTANAVWCLTGRLRQKLSSVEPDIGNYIQTVRHVGYKFALK